MGPHKKLKAVARALFGSRPDAAVLGAFGLRESDFERETIGVWPCNQRAVDLFLSIQTQWRMGPGGAVGLDYGVLYHKLDRMDLSPREYDRIEDQVRTIEFEALAVMQENHKARQKR